MKGKYENLGVGIERRIARFRSASRAKRHSWNTTRDYERNIRKYAKWCLGLTDPNQYTSSQKLQKYLTQLAPDVAASTQSQILNSLVFFYRFAMDEHDIDIGPFAHAKKPKRLPEWLTKPQVAATLAQMTGVYKLQAQLCFGAGLRLMECYRLRIKDLDFHTRQITVRGGKGDKDRVTCLPPSLIQPLQQQIQYAQMLHERDRLANAPGVHLPDGVARKYPKYGEDWAWFWLWPGKKPSRDPESGIVRRHHLHERGLQMQLKAALDHARIAKRVTVHSLRHSFATHFLMDGGDIYRLSKLLGHESIETTAIYLHCIPNFAGAITSPLETLESVVQFPPDSSCELSALG